VTARARRHVLFAFVVVALTIPTETILLQALATSSPQQAARTWISGLSAAQLDAIADQVQQYPFVYRKEIMRAVSPDKRASTWKNHIKRYIDTHPELDGGAVALLNAAVDLAESGTFSGSVSEATKSQVAALGAEIKNTLGADVADYLLYRLGPKDGLFASAEPFSQRLANMVRSAFIALAEEQADCDCNIGFGGCGSGSYCKENTGCRLDEEWPMCGWFWNEVCDGRCAAGWPHEG
jgi:hypothetical protein